MSKWSVVSQGRKAKIFPTKTEAMKYYSKCKKTGHKLIMMLHYKDGKWRGVKRS